MMGASKDVVNPLFYRMTIPVNYLRLSRMATRISDLGSSSIMTP